MKKKSWEFPGGPLVKGSELLLQGAWVLPLVGELRFHKAEQPKKIFKYFIFEKSYDKYKAHVGFSQTQRLCLIYEICYSYLLSIYYEHMGKVLFV